MEAGGGHQDAEGGIESGSASKALELLFTVEVEKDMDEDFTCWEARLQEKLGAFLDKRITQEEFEKNLEGEAATAERSKVMGDEETREVETQVWGEMDVDSGEDEVVMVVTQKQVLSLPPKTVWKRAHATTRSQEMVAAAVINQNVSVAACEQCLQ